MLERPVLTTVQTFAKKEKRSKGWGKRLLLLTTFLQPNSPTRHAEKTGGKKIENVRKTEFVGIFVIDLKREEEDRKGNGDN